MSGKNGVKLSQQIVGQIKVGPEFGFRPKTKVNEWKVKLVMNSGGMGDFLNYSAATLWLAKNCPWVKAQLFAPQYICEVMRDIHKGFKQIKVTPSEHFNNYFKSGDHLIGANILIMGRNISPQFYNATGGHLMDVGFAYYCSMTTPEGEVLPTLDYPMVSLDERFSMLDGLKYVVIPTGNVHQARAVHGKHVNPLIDAVLDRGLTPVFLGKRDMAGTGKSLTKFPDDIAYEKGIDLRDQTTVKEAATILQHAQATVGLDCGLLHLAAMMKGSRLVFGYNITTVEHREPRRNHGRHENVFLTTDELQCSACQSRYRQMAGHWFDKCLYGDSKCVDMLYDNGAERFVAALDRVLEN